MRHRDEGFTLVELLVAIVLGGLVSGVVVAAMVTSMNIADSTNDQLKDSTDASLISAFLYRDAQSAGGTDPALARPDPSVGVSTSDWGECEQEESSLVVRFSWYDREAVAIKSKVVATYALDSDGQLVRRLCQDGTETDAVLARAVEEVTASCSPTCDQPSSVELAISGSGDRSPFSFTLTASLRRDVQAQPDTTNSSSVALVAFGGDSSCPNLSMDDTVKAMGDVAVGPVCAPDGAATQGSLEHLPGGITTTLSGMTNPLADLAAPDYTCDDTGSNPAAGTPGTYHQPVVLTTSVTFQAGTYVFCDGLSIGANASVTGNGVFFYVAGGTFTVDPGVTLVDLTAPSSGAYENVLAWVVASQEPVTLRHSDQASTYGGLVYAPTSHVVVSRSPGTAANIGGIVARTIAFDGAGLSTRVGLPIPPVAPGNDILENGTEGELYSTTLVGSGGQAPYDWFATGLPGGLSMDTAGTISGTPGPDTAGNYEVIVTALDATFAAGSRVYSLTIEQPGCAKPWAIGGTVTVAGGYRIHTFTTVGTSEFVVERPGCVEYLVIAGGGGGSDGGGGGAGGYRSNVPGEPSGGGASAENPLELAPGTYGVTVGAGGAGGPNNGTGDNGSNSIFSTITSTGGGAAGRFFNSGSVGGSGGGGGGASGPGTAPGGSGTAGEGFAGGSGGPAGNYPGGGGGGAGAAGGDHLNSFTGGAGGAGVSSSITGTAVVRAGGGGGIAVGSGAVGGVGGAGGGGNGSAARPGGALSTAGAPNTGGGGGGGSTEENGLQAGPKPGGSGIVIIRYPL